MTEQTQEQKCTVKLYLKHGHVISFTCTEFKSYRDGFGNYTKAEWKGIDKRVDFDLSDLIAYTVEEMKVGDE